MRFRQMQHFNCIHWWCFGKMDAVACLDSLLASNMVQLPENSRRVLTIARSNETDEAEGRTSSYGLQRGVAIRQGQRQQLELSSCFLWFNASS